MIRVVLADDQALVRAGFRLILKAESDVDVVGEASNGFEAVAAALTHQPDVVLMDVRMPELDGIEATARTGNGERQIPAEPGCAIPSPPLALPTQRSR